MFKRILLCLVLLPLLASCSGANLNDYRDEKPLLDMQQYFNGRLNAWGMFQNRSGKVVKRFTVLIDAKWQGDKGTLEEHFTYADGTTQQRTWHLAKQPDGRYVGRADDIVGEAIGEVAGNTLHWQYVMALPVDGTTYHVNFDDWMYLIDEKTMINRSEMRKFGFYLGNVTLFFQKEPK